MLLLSERFCNSLFQVQHHIFYFQLLVYLYKGFFPSKPIQAFLLQYSGWFFRKIGVPGAVPLVSRICYKAMVNGIVVNVGD